MASKSIFPDEIMIEILLKLPVKSILRCKTLSKHYYSLIHSKYFIRRHLTLGPLYDQSIISPIIRGSVRLFDRRGHIQVLQATPPFASEPSIMYHGLYCVIDTMNDRFAIWNPTTREQFIFPPVPLTPDTGESKSELGNRQCYVYGFGYDDTTDEYKFVFNYTFFPDSFYDLDVDPHPPNAKSSFNIFNISKGEWRSIEPWSGVVAREPRFRIGVFVHGACHWSYASGSTGFMILAFNMVTESHRFIALPIVRDKYVWSNTFIVSFNGCLGFVNAQGENMPKLSSSFDVWVMAEYGVTQSWTILLRVALPDGIRGRYLGIVRDRIYIRKGDGCMVSYDLYSKDEERYDILDSVVGSLLPYEESLVRIIKSVS